MLSSIITILAVAVLLFALGYVVIWAIDRRMRKEDEQRNQEKS